MLEQKIVSLVERKEEAKKKEENKKRVSFVIEKMRTSLVNSSREE